MMLDEQGALRRGSPGVGSPATGRHLEPRHRKIPVSEHRSRTREHKLVHYTHRPIPDVVRRSRGPFTHLCRAERECKSANRKLSPAQTTVLSFRCWSERKVVWDCLYCQIHHCAEIKLAWWGCKTRKTNSRVPEIKNPERGCALFKPSVEWWLGLNSNREVLSKRNRSEHGQSRGCGRWRGLVTHGCGHSRVRVTHG